MVDFRNYSHQFGLSGDALDQRGQLVARQSAKWRESEESGFARCNAGSTEVEWQSSERIALLQHVAIYSERAGHVRQRFATVLLWARHAELRSGSAADIPNSGIEGAAIPAGNFQHFQSRAVFRTGGC